MDREEIQNFIKILKPLDLILIQGVTSFSQLIQNGSELIKGNGEFSHCGLVINKDVCPAVHIKNDDNKTADMAANADEINKLWFMEVTVSILDEVPSIETGNFSLGAQIRDLESVLEELLEKGAGVAVCHLKHNPYVDAVKNKDEFKIKQIQMVLENDYDKYFANDKSIYDLNVFALLGTIFPSVRWLRDDIDKMFSFIRDHHPWLFCSELICIIYRDLGLLDADIDTQNYLPVDFVNPGPDNKVYSIMELPPVFLKQIHTPTREEAKKWCWSCWSNLCNIL